MRKTGFTKTCPECGRNLETTFNRFNIECWPTHKIVSYNKIRSFEWQAIWEANWYRSIGDRDWERQCLNSGQPVLNDE